MFILTTASSVILDLIRVILIQLVLFGHLNDYFHLVNWLSPPVFSFIQNIAVSGFFLLSGFLIPYSLNKKTSTKTYFFKEYFFDRLMRIYIVVIPALFFTIIIDFIHLYFNQGTYRFINAFNLKTFITNLLMLQYFPSIPFGSNRPIWVLGLLWWLYLAFGWWWFNHHSWRRRPALAISTLLIFSAIPLISLFHGRGQGLVLIWLLGAAVFYLLKYHYFSWMKHRLSLLLSGIFFCLSLVCVFFTKNEFGLQFGILLALSFLFLLNNFQSYPRQTILPLKKVFRGFSDYSFTLYLTHYPIIVLILSLNLHLNSYQYFFLLFFLTNLFAYLIAQITEMKTQSL
ncbi:MAG: acyltransferase, partial [Patescibacteria group bacterium]|nr:acyltransferase [Patescibacteria group bacterium]